MTHSDLYQGVTQTTDQGTTIWVKGDPRFTMYGLRLGFRAGSVHDPVGQEGIAHCLEHMVFRGAGPFKTKLDIVGPLEDSDGRCGAYTNKEETVYQVDTDHLALEHSLKVLTGFAAQPHFNGLDQERQTILQECRTDLTTPSYRAILEGARRLYKKPAWSHDTLGTLETIERFSKQNLIDFHQRHYHSQNAVVVITGPSSTQELLDIANQLADAIPTGRDQTPAAASPKGNKGTETLKWEHQAGVAILRRLHPLATNNATIAAVTMDMLGSGMSSPVFQRLREQAGYVYHYGCVREHDRTYGMIGFGAPVSPDRIDAFWHDFWDMATDPDSFSAERLEREKRRTQAYYRHHPISASRVASNAMADIMNSGQVATIAQEVSKTKAVTIDEVHHFVSQYLAPGAGLQLSLIPE